MSLHESEHRYRELANSLPNIVFETDMTGLITFTNKMAYVSSGYSQEDFEKGLNVLQFLPPEEREKALNNIQLLLEGGDSFPIEYTFVRKNGTTFPVLVTTNVIVRKNKAAGLRGVVSDITERKKSEEIVRKSEERYRELANSLPEIVFETDIAGKITFFSDSALEKTSYSREEFEKGLIMLSFVASEERAKAAVNMRKSMAGENNGSNEYTLCRKDGTTFPALVSTSPIISGNKVTGLRGLVIDITERKKSEEIVRKSEERYRELANSLPEIVFETDLTGKITFLSQRAFGIIGLTREELEKDLNMLSFVVPEEREKAKEHLRKAFLGEKREDNEYKLCKKNGDTLPVLVSTSPIISGNKVTGLRGLIIDITERKKAEEDMKMAAHILDLATDMIFVHDMEGNIVNFNETSCKLLGYDKEEMARMNIRDLDLPEFAVQIEPRVKMLFERGDAVFDSVHLCKDKSTLPVEVHARIVDLNGRKRLQRNQRHHRTQEI